MTKTRSVMPSDPLDIASPFGSDGGAVERLAHDVDALQRVVIAMCAVLTPGQLLKVCEVLSGTSPPTVYEKYVRVELTK